MALSFVHKMNNALEILKNMEAELGAKPNSVTYREVLKTCKSNSVKATEVFQEMKDRSLSPDIKTYNLLLNIYAKKRENSMVYRILEEMEQSSVVPDLVTYSTVIACYAYEGKWEKALDLLNVRTCITYFTAYNLNSHMENAKRFYHAWTSRSFLHSGKYVLTWHEINKINSTYKTMKSKLKSSL